MIRVPRQFNGAFITRHFFPQFLKYNNVQGINSGYCYDWAYYAYRMFPGVTLWTTDYHAWVQVGKKFFDSETRVGVSNFLALGCNVRHAPDPWEERSPTRIGVDDFKRFWDHHGGGYKRHWDSMLEANLKRVLGNRYSDFTPIFHQPKPALVVP